jgi:hypothetical protein
MDSQSDSPFEVHSAPEIRMASLPRDGSHTNEDLAVVFGNVAWVLDGASDPLTQSERCSHNASWYVRAFSRALAVALEQQPSATLRELLATAIDSTRTAHDTMCGQAVCLQPSAAVALGRWSTNRLEYLVLGDCSILHSERDGVASITDARLEKVAAEIRTEILERLRLGYGFADPKRLGLLRELVEAEQNARNTNDGYWIAAYDSDAAQHAVAGTLSLDRSQPDPTVVAFLSDGLDRAVRLFPIHNSCERFLDALKNDGPGSAIHRVRRAERADPTGFRFPRTKPTDDASGIVLTWS